MDGSGTREQSKSHNETIADNRRYSCGQPEEKRTLYHLPDKLLHHIISKLTLKDNRRASVVDKRFLAIANAVQKADKPPWLLFHPKFGDIYESRDPYKDRFEFVLSNRRDSNGHQPEEKHTQYYLPEELWQDIISKLTLKDNIRSSAVSRRFFAIAKSVRKASKPPWLLISDGDTYKFHNPFKLKPYFLLFPELIGTSFVHSKDGWLIVSNPNTSRLFLFCPYTRELIELPTISLRHSLIELSSAPTSQGCVVFVLDYIDFRKNRIKTWRPGETKWNDVDLQNNTHLGYIIWHKVTFCNGLFYCFSCTGRDMGIFNPNESSWIVQSVKFSEFDIDWWRYGFIAEHDGAIIAAYDRTRTHKIPVIYKLDLFNKIWVRMESLRGMTLFIDVPSCHARSGLHENMRDNIYFSVLYADRCHLYSLEQGSYFPTDQWPRWGEIGGNSIWIDAPEEEPFSSSMKGDGQIGNSTLRASMRS